MVVPEVMHHITQQGNWRLQTFFCDEDYEAYIDLMSPCCTHGDIEVWAYDKTHRYLAARYVELNPVRAKLVKKPQEYRWSSAPAHIAGRDDRLVHVAPLLEMFGKWDDFLSRGLSDDEVEKFRCHERTGRPLGTDRFLGRLENILGRILHKQKPGPKRSQKKNKNL